MLNHLLPCRPIGDPSDFKGSQLRHPKVTYFSSLYFLEAHCLSLVHILGKAWKSIAYSKWYYSKLWLATVESSTKSQKQHESMGVVTWHSWSSLHHKHHPNPIQTSATNAERPSFPSSPEGDWGCQGSRWYHLPSKCKWQLGMKLNLCLVWELPNVPSRELTYPTLGKGKIIFKMPFWGDMLVPWR